jgi:hypothetical protein
MPGDISLLCVQSQRLQNSKTSEHKFKIKQKLYSPKKCKIGQKRCEIGQNIIVKKSARLDNKKVRDWAIFVKQKKSARLGEKDARLDNSHN